MRLILFAIVIVSLSLTACNKEKAESKAETSSEVVKETSKKEHDHADHNHGSDGHMDHMNDVREWLKTELGDNYDSKLEEATDEMLAEGEKVYVKSCAVCHGDSGKGDGAAAAAFESKPADFTDAAHSSYYSDMGRIYIIKNGVKGTPMVGMSGALSDEEINSVYAYVKSLRISDGSEGGHHSGEGDYSCPMHPEITGNKGDKCSKCGMDLEPKKAETKEGDGHDHQH